MTNPRSVTPIQWGTLVLTSVALTHATALPAQTTEPVAQVAASAEGGEGGEAGAVIGKTDGQAYLIRLVTVDGHLRAGVEAYRRGFVPEAIALVGHPEAEVLDDLSPQMQARGAGDLYEQIDAISAAMGQGLSPNDVDAAYTSAQDVIAAAMARGDGGIAGQLDAIYVSLAGASAEYEQSLDNGLVADPVAWEEAHGFFIAAADMAARLSATGSAAAASAYKSIAPARDAFVYDGDNPQPVDSALLYGSAAQVEFAALTAR